MGKGFRPQASSLVESRHRKKEPKQIDLNGELDEEVLAKAYGKIFFWSFTVTKIKPTDHATVFRVCSHRFINILRVRNLVEPAFPEGCRITPVRGYKYLHTFDVKVTNPLMWKTFIQRIVKALEGVI